MRSNRLNYFAVGLFVIASIVGVIVAVSIFSGRTGATDGYVAIYRNVIIDRAGPAAEDRNRDDDADQRGDDEQADGEIIQAIASHRLTAPVTDSPVRRVR